MAFAPGSGGGGAPPGQQPAQMMMPQNISAETYHRLNVSFWKIYLSKRINVDSEIPWKVDSCEKTVHQMKWSLSQISW